MAKQNNIEEQKLELQKALAKILNTARETDKTDQIYLKSLKDAKEAIELLQKENSELKKKLNEATKRVSYLEKANQELLKELGKSE